MMKDPPGSPLSIRDCTMSMTSGRQAAAPRDRCVVRDESRFDPCVVCLGGFVGPPPTSQPVILARTPIVPPRIL